MDKKPSILFTATFNASFIREDLQLLRAHFRVTDVIASGTVAFFRYLFVLPAADLTFSWFASVYSSILIFFTKLFGKRSVLILGGVDVAKLPEAHYGIWNSRWKSVIVRYGITHADIVLAVDSSIKKDAMTLSRYDGKNISVLPTGHNEQFWIPGSIKKEKLVLTVAACGDLTRFKIKGIDFLYTVARAMPETSFVLVGLSETVKRQFPPPENVRSYGIVPPEELLGLYQCAQVYFQPSMREALGSTICEAMLCECYPVGTNVGGIPTVIGSTGAVISFNDTAAASAEILKGFMSGPALAARERIISHFSLGLRESALKNIIMSLYHE
ncbi:MAG: glycosyltransferase family 4 protein [Bacteroidota bacterium]